MNMAIAWEQRPGYLLSAVGAHVQLRFAELLAPHGMLPHHFGLLRRVSSHEGQTQQELADAMQLRRAAVVGLVDDLEALGVLERRRHPVDRRANALHLTAAGKRLVTKLAAAITVLEDELLDPLPDEVRTAFLDGLRQVALVVGVADGVYPHPADDEHAASPPKTVTPRSYAGGAARAARAARVTAQTRTDRKA